MSSDTAELLENDWLDTPNGRLLHYATGLATDDDETVWDDVLLACGKRVAWACIPGMFTRMSARRCAACCEVRGLPRGKGSPKNDDACRLILGLPVGEDKP